MSRIETLVARCEQLYESVVTDPHEWSDDLLAEWAQELVVGGDPPDKETRRQIRAVIRSARKLRSFWSEDAAARATDHGDWRSRVDIAVGARAWRPVLDLAMHGLEQHPSPELFDIVQDRFAVVTSQRWMEGVDYDTWLDSR